MPAPDTPDLAARLAEMEMNLKQLLAGSRDAGTVTILFGTDEVARLRQLLADARRELDRLNKANELGVYQCGCPVQRSERVKAFCAVHCTSVVAAQPGGSATGAGE